MINYDQLKHITYIEKILKSDIAIDGALQVGNNLNNYFTYYNALKDYVSIIAKKGNARKEKSSQDAIMGRLAEEILIYLLNQYFIENKKNYNISFDDSGIKKQIKIVNEKLLFEKIFDIDIIISNNSNKYFLLSCKGTARERIGQFLSNLFLMDDRLIKKKYNDRYYLEFKRNNSEIMYGFVCYDWSKNKDFIKYNKSGSKRNTIKETEVNLINDENYISGGITVLNNDENLDGIMNFAELVGKISKFLN